MRGAIAVKTWQRQSGAMPQLFLHAREQKSLFVDRQQHIEMLRGQQVLDESEKSGRVVAQSRATMKFFGQSAKTSRGTSDWDRRPQRGDLTARGS